MVPRHRALLLRRCSRPDLRTYQGLNTLVLQVQRVWVLSPVLPPQYFRPQTVYVSPLFLQIIAYLLGLVMEEVIPGPNNVHERLRTKDNAFWRFMNPGPFSKLPSRVLSPLRHLFTPTLMTDIKEHVAITIFSTTAAESALAISIFAADSLYYNLSVRLLLPSHGLHILIAVICLF